MYIFQHFPEGIEFIKLMTLSTIIAHLLKVIWNIDEWKPIRASMIGIHNAFQYYLSTHDCSICPLFRIRVFLPRYSNICTSFTLGASTHAVWKFWRLSSCVWSLSATPNDVRSGFGITSCHIHAATATSCVMWTNLANDTSSWREMILFFF